MTYYEEIYVTKKILWEQLYSSWINYELFSLPWWVTIGALITIYFIWWKALDKSRIIELLLFGSLLAVMSALIDTVADNLMLWQYKVRLLPFSPAFFPYHLTIAPIILMLVYQYTSTWKSFLLWTAISGAIYSFVFIPTFVSLGEVHLLRWKYHYNFITFFLRACVGRWLLMLFKQFEFAYHSKSAPTHFFSSYFQHITKKLPAENTKKKPPEH